MSERRYEELEVHLSDPFAISYSKTDKKTNIIVRLDEGLGAAAPSTTCNETTRTVLAAMPKLLRCVGEEIYDLAGFHQRAKLILPDNPAAKAAVDVALYDRAARRAGLPLYQFLGLPNPDGMESTISIGIDTVEGTLTRMAKFPGTRVFKIKAGYPGDVERILQIAAESGARLRVDANGGWDIDEAQNKIERLYDAGVELIEQPLAYEHRHRLGALRAASPLPIFVDEGCRTAVDVFAYADLVDGINVKIMKCGGLGPALEMVAVARALGLKIMLGCMLECAVTTTAAAHIAGMFDFLDLDSHLLLADDPYHGLVHRDGTIVLPKGPGSGVTRVEE